MEYGSRIRLILFTITGIALLIFSAWGIASIARNIFGSSKKSSNTAQEQRIKLEDYQRPSTSVKLTVEGPIIADEKYVSYEIEIAQDFREISYYKGYGKTLVAKKHYSNNVTSYESFMQALEHANYTLKSNRADDSEVGACATGKRYIYSLTDVSEDVLRTWGDSCSVNQGTFGGNGSAVRSLFRNQIPDFSDILRTSGLI